MLDAMNVNEQVSWLGQQQQRPRAKPDEWGRGQDGKSKATMCLFSGQCNIYLHSNAYHYHHYYHYYHYYYYYYYYYLLGYSHLLVTLTHIPSLVTHSSFTHGHPS